MHTHTHTRTHTVWQWQDEHGVWRDYDPSLCHKLEAAHNGSRGAGGSVSFTAAGRSYTVDVSKMEQTNTATGVGRKVARRAPVAPPGMAISTKSHSCSSVLALHVPFPFLRTSIPIPVVWKSVPSSSSMHCTCIACSPLQQEIRVH